MRLHDYTVGFTVKRTWNQLLNALFFSSDEACPLCQRPMYEMERFDSKTNVTDVMPNVCLFCLQDAQFSVQNVKKRMIQGVRVTGRIVPPVETYCAANYEGLIREAIRQWKYDGATQWTTWFATLVAQAWKQYGNVNDAYRKNVVLVPVPIGQGRLAKRGYHHVGLLASAVSNLMSIPLVPALVQREDSSTSFTQSQTALNRTERLQAVWNRYAVNPRFQVEGLDVCILDDIVTTGSTMVSCAHVLRQAGANSVTGIVVASVE